MSGAHSTRQADAVLAGELLARHQRRADLDERHQRWADEQAAEPIFRGTPAYLGLLPAERGWGEPAAAGVLDSKLLSSAQHRPAAGADPHGHRWPLLDPDAEGLALDEPTAPLRPVCPPARRVTPNADGYAAAGASYPSAPAAAPTRHLGRWSA